MSPMIQSLKIPLRGGVWVRSLPRVLVTPEISNYGTGRKIGRLAAAALAVLDALVRLTLLPPDPPARPSGTEDVYKIYAESFKGQAHLEELKREAREIVSAAFTRAGV